MHLNRAATLMGYHNPMRDWRGLLVCAWLAGLPTTGLMPAPPLLLRGRLVEMDQRGLPNGVRPSRRSAALFAQAVLVRAGPALAIGMRPAPGGCS
jgi:hypothetical protein